VPIKALRGPTRRRDRDCNDRLIEIATGQFDHLATQAILCLVGRAAAQTREFEPDRSGDRPAPRVRDRVDDQRSYIGEERNKLGGPDHSCARRSYRCVAGNLAMQRPFRRRTEVRIFIGVVARACKTQSP